MWDVRSRDWITCVGCHLLSGGTWRHPIRRKFYQTTYNLSRPSWSYNGRDWMRSMDTWTHRDHPIKIERMKSRDAFFSRVTWWNLDSSSLIKWTWLNDVDLSNDVLSQPLIRSNRHIRRLRPISPINWDVLRDGKPLWIFFFSNSNCLDTTILESLYFYIFKTHFRVQGVFEIRNWSRKLEEIISWTPNFIFEIVEWKALNPEINCIILSTTLG